MEWIVKLSQWDPFGIELGSNFYQIIAKRIKDSNALMQDIKRKIRLKFLSEETIRIVLEGIRGIEIQKNHLLLRKSF